MHLHRRFLLPVVQPQETRPVEDLVTGDNSIDIEIKRNNSSSSVHPVDSGGSIIGILTCACLHTAARKCESFIWNVIALLVGTSDQGFDGNQRSSFVNCTPILNTVQCSDNVFCRLRRFFCHVTFLLFLQKLRVLLENPSFSCLAVTFKHEITSPPIKAL